MDSGTNSRRVGSPGNEDAATTVETATAAGSTGSESSDSGQPLWRPRTLGFQPFPTSPGSGVESCSRKFNELRVMVKRPHVSKLTKDIVETYQICNPKFKYSETLNPKRFLTSPHVGALNEGFDNANSDLILSVNFVLINGETQRRYIVKDMLGQGTFGQVAKCWVSETNSYVAVKIIKNLPAYYHQAVHEVSILRMLNENCDPNDTHHIVRMLDCFVFQRHLCISFEMLGSNLYELLRMNQLKGLSLNLVQMFSKQILHALIIMKDAGIIHCDLKPENILLWTSIKPTGLKVIDFGSACREGQTVYSYIQSRYYRSPEVLLGYPYTTAIDMWSFGCIVAELFLGLPLFPGASEYDLLKRMIAVMDEQPPDFFLRAAKNTNKFFKHPNSVSQLGNKEAYQGGTISYCLLTEQEYEAKERKKPAIGKWYFNYVKLEDIVADYPYRRNLSEEEKSKERLIRLALIDFLRGLVEFDPEKRWTPLQASGHPFMTGELFTHPYRPPPATSHIPVIHNFAVDHRGQGHWLTSGFSPQVSSAGRGYQHCSPRFQMPLYHSGSYGSIGSYGSYGSYGDGSNMQAYFSPAGSSGLSFPMQIGESALGASPEARGVLHNSCGNGFGRSPAGTFRPTSIGASPSQFTPHSSQVQISNSPGKYGSASPARGNIHNYPLGKTAAVAQYGMRRSWGHPGTLPLASPESTSHQLHGNSSDGPVSSYLELSSHGHVVSPRGAQMTFNQTRSKREKESPADHSESISALPDPGDWDPNYSDDLLLQEDSFEVGNLVSGTNHLHLGSLLDASVLTDRSNHHYLHDHQVSNSGSHKLRADGSVQAYSNMRSSQSSVNEIYSSPPISLQHHTSHLPQNSPTRFAQQPHRFNHAQQIPAHGDRNCHKSHLTRPSYSSADSHSVSNITFGRGAPWGQGSGHPITNVVRHQRDPYGRIV